MGTDEFLETMAGQIRSGRARAMAKKEMEDHIKDQAEAYREAGMTREEAYKEAVHQMGDPVAAGVELDRIHRPRMDWRLLTWIILFSILGLVIQYVCFYDPAAPGHMGGRAGSMGDFLRQCGYTAAGLAAMTAVCLVDYSILGRRPGILGALFLGGIWMVCRSGMLRQINGSYPYMKCFTYLFVPLYGGILYKNRGKGYPGIGLGLMWIFLLFLVGVRAIGGGLGVTIDAVLACIIMLFAAVWKQWFGLSKKSGLGAVILILGALALFFAISLEPYQLMRIQVWLRPEDYSETAGYHLNTIRTIVSDLSLNKSSYGILEQRGLARFLENQGVYSEFTILQTAVTLGIVKAACLCGLFAAFFLSLFLRAGRQKNHLGQITAMGCTMVLALETLGHVLNNLGIGLISTGGLPFFSYGKWHTMVVYLLLGILLSIYRHENLVWEEPVKPYEGERTIVTGPYVIRIEKRPKSSH